MYVLVHCVRGDEQPLGDLAVGEPKLEVIEHLQLSPRELVEPGSVLDRQHVGVHSKPFSSLHLSTSLISLATVREQWDQTRNQEAAAKRGGIPEPAHLDT